MIVFDGNTMFCCIHFKGVFSPQCLNSGSTHLWMYVAESTVLVNKDCYNRIPFLCQYPFELCNKTRCR
jgi:hypothetical protein